MALTSVDVLKTFKQNGLRLTIISVASTICLGVADQFTGRIIPSIATRIDHFVDPPKFFVTFDAPVDISAGVTVTALGAEGAPSVAIKKAGERALAVHAGPGAYELRLLRRQNNVTQELVDTKLIEKTTQLWPVDTNERNWANEAALRGGIASGASPAAEPLRLAATRWSLTERDFAVVASVQDPALRSMLANALAEVGIFRTGNGSREAPHPLILDRNHGRDLGDHALECHLRRVGSQAGGRRTSEWCRQCGDLASLGRGSRARRA